MELNFFKPRKLEDAAELLYQYPNAKILAGGTDLLLDIRRGGVNPSCLVDLSLIPGLKEIDEDEDTIKIGSMVTFSQLKENPVINKYYNSLIDCAKSMGSPQIRNMATIGGNIINAGAAADIIPCIMSLDGVLLFESKHGHRKVSCTHYFKQLSDQMVRSGEILTGVILPKRNTLSAYFKLGKRNSLAIARISLAISLSMKNDIIQDLSISLGAVGRYPFRVKELELYALGKSSDWLRGDEPLVFLEQAVFESIKGRKTMPFKKEAIKGVYKEALNKALKIDRGLL